MAEEYRTGIIVFNESSSYNKPILANLVRTAILKGKTRKTVGNLSLITDIDEADISLRGQNVNTVLVFGLKISSLTDDTRYLLSKLIEPNTIDKIYFNGVEFRANVCAVGG